MDNGLLDGNAASGAKNVQVTSTSDRVKLTGLTVRQCASVGIDINAGSAGIVAVRDCELISQSVTTTAEIEVSGTSPNVSLLNNSFTGKLTTNADDQGLRVTRRNNRGADTFSGFAQTTDPTLTVMTLRGLAYIPLASGRAASFARVYAWRTASSVVDCASYELRGLLHNQGGVVAVVGSITISATAETDATMDAEAAADAANGLKITVTGVAGKSFNWLAEVTFSRN